MAGHADEPAPAGANEGALALLHAALLAAERRAATLAQLSGVLGSTRDPLALVQRAVDLVGRATGAVGAFVYLWDRASERLVLKAATEGRQRPYVDAIGLRLGEGVTGWAALMRRHAVINRGLHDDPRFIALPGLGEAEFRSMLAAPILVAGDDILGVFALYSHVEGGFSDDDVSLVDEVATILASGLRQAETVDELRRESSAARFLLGFDRDAFRSRAAFARELAQRVRAVVPCEVCVVEIVDEQGLDDALGIGVASGAAQPRIIDRASLPRLLEQHAAGYERLVQTLRLADGPPLGVVTCHRPGAFTSGDRAMAEVVAAQAGAALAATAARRTSQSLLAELRDGSDPARALRLLRGCGWRATGSALPLVVRVRSAGSGDQHAADRARRLLREALEPAGAFAIPSAGTVLGFLVPAPDGVRVLPAAAHDELRRLAPEVGSALAIGVGPPLAAARPEVAAAIGAAWTASLWAELEAGPLGVIHHDEVAHLQALPAVARSVGPELAVRIAELRALAAHDAEHGSELFATLDAYLAHCGSVATTAASLFVHRNTLRQRLQRIEGITGRPPEQTDDWLVAALAARLVREAG